jgi:hypothetical protein
LINTRVKQYGTEVDELIRVLAREEVFVGKTAVAMKQLFVL